MNEQQQSHTSGNDVQVEYVNEPTVLFNYDSSQKPVTVEAIYEEVRTSSVRGGSNNGGDRRDERKRKKGSAARTLLASFLAGALVVGSMTYMSDRLNLFTGGTQGPIIVNASASGNGEAAVAASLKTASLGASEPISAIFEQANPAVVEIENYGVPTNAYGAYLFGGRGGRGMEQRQSNAEPQLMGTGTGFFFSEDGYILTNQHVIADATELKVTVPGYDESLTARVVSADEQLDIAVLKVESPDGNAFPTLTIGDSDQTSIGDWVIAIGNPYGLDHTMTVGVLSAKERPITIAEEDGSEHLYEHLLQTDASINPGNSGGPLLNDKGEVIGMNTAVNAEAQGIGFAISSTTIQDALATMMAGVGGYDANNA